MRKPSPALVVAVIALCVALSGSAIAEPVADSAASLASNVKKALKLAKAADKRSKQALSRAQRQGPQGPKGETGPQGLSGPQGPAGAAGPAGSIQGAAAGGDLDGTYPDPEIAANAIGEPEVAPNSLGGGDINESSLGSVPSANQAGNAGTLDNLDSLHFQRRCQDGAIKGFVRVDGASDFSSSYTSTGTALGFNCAGGAPRAKRMSEGVYRVCFPSSVTTLAFTTSTGVDSTGEDNVISVEPRIEALCSSTDLKTWEVHIVDEDDTSGVDHQDERFYILAL